MRGLFPAIYKGKFMKVVLTFEIEIDEKTSNNTLSMVRHEMESICKNAIENNEIGYSSNIEIIDYDYSTDYYKDEY